MKRRKRKCDLQEVAILVRFTAEQKKRVVVAARKADMGISGWIRYVALLAAKDGTAIYP